MRFPSLAKRVCAGLALPVALVACGGGGTSVPSATFGTQSTASRPAASTAVRTALCHDASDHCIKHVLLLSIDGLHQIDLARYVQMHPTSALATLSASGITYANARTTGPSDSFPGLLALVTGGHPQSTGVYYEVSYDRSLYPPGSSCVGAPGTVVAFDESIDRNPNDINAGGGIDPTTLTLSNANGACAPVFPHDYLRVNTLFEVVKAAGGRTAWSDKEHSYEILNGPSGHGVDDLYDLEIAAGGTTGSETATQRYDALKVAAILNEIDGKTSTGAAGVGVPALFGMNFQAVSVGQKLAVEGTKVSPDPLAGQHGGYTDPSGTPGPLLASGLDFVDASLGKMVAEIAKNGLTDSTLVVVSAKHGQTPIDITQRRGIKGAGGTIGTALAANSVGFVQTDDLALVWLNDRSPANEADALAKLQPLASQLGFSNGHLYTNTATPPFYGAPTDPRTPDFSIAPDIGVIYTGGTKIAEHGGFSDEDEHVGLLVSGPGIKPLTVTDPVQTTQVAPTILTALGIPAQRLQAVAQEGTQILPQAKF